MFATELVRAGGKVADVRVFHWARVGQDDLHLLASGDGRQEHVVPLRERGRATLDDDRDAA